MRLGESVRLSVLVCALAAAAACGGAGGAEEGAESASPDRTTTSAPSAEGEDGAATDTTAGAGEGGGADGSSTTTAPTVPPTTDPDNPLTTPGPKGRLAVRAELARDCVRAGDVQGISVVTEPGSGVGYDTVYADGRSGLMEGHYGGNFGGTADESGKWSHSWVVAPNAPAGRVQVNLLASHMDWGHTQQKLFFVVADAAGNCA